MKTDISSLVDNNPRLQQFKRQAKILLRQIKTNIKPDVTLRSCQDLVAQQNGYKHWYEFHTEIKKIYEIKKNDIKNYFYKTLPDIKHSFNYGYSADMGLHYCLGQNDRLNHTLILGDNREKINWHFAKQAIEANENLVFMDGSGQSNSFFKLFDFAKKNNRAKDVFFINFMTGAKTSLENKLSNTFNPFSSGSSGVLTEFMLSLMDGDDGGGDMWKGRAISLISSIMMALVHMRDVENFNLNFQSLRDYLLLDKIVNLYNTRIDFPHHIRNALRAYLVSLPGFQESAPKQNDTVLEQHGYLQMQFTKLLGSLSDSYGYIFNAVPEINLEYFTSQSKKVIIFVQFPCFEKSTDEIKILSYLMLNTLKQQLSSLLNSDRTLKAINHTNWIINDCPVNLGISILPACARAKHISLLFSYKDITFNHSDNNEAMSLAANCNIKINMDSATHYQLQYKTERYNLNI